MRMGKFSFNSAEVIGRKCIKFSDLKCKANNDIKCIATSLNELVQCLVISSINFDIVK